MRKCTDGRLALRAFPCSSCEVFRYVQSDCFDTLPDEFTHARHGRRFQKLSQYFEIRNQRDMTFKSSIGDDFNLII